MRCLWLFLLFLLLGSPTMAQPLCLEWDLQRDVTVDGQTTEGQKQKVRVVLTDSYLEFQDNDGRVVHDFTTLTSHLVSGDDYVRRSLYADIGFRAAELRNRLKVIEALKATNARAGVGQVVTAEHLLAIDDEVSEAGIVKAQGKTISYTHGGTLLAQFSEQGRPLNPPQARAFVRFLRYYCGGHPDILSDVQVRGVLPTDLRIDVTNVNETVSFKMHLASFESCGPARPDFSALRPTDLPAEPLGTLYALVLQLSPNASETVRQRTKAQADQAFSEGRMLEAALRLFEVLLIEGADSPPEIAQRRKAFEADADARLMLGALTWGAEDPEKAIQALRSLEAKAGPTAHVLKIFQAGFLLPKGELVEARNLLIEALMVNPAIAGAWKDLGDIYHSNYETDVAWLCWDAGRKLAPDHAMLVDVGKLEQALRSNYPGFF